MNWPGWPRTNLVVQDDPELLISQVLSFQTGLKPWKPRKLDHHVHLSLLASLTHGQAQCSSVGKSPGSRIPSKQIKRRMKINITILRKGVFFFIAFYVFCVYVCAWRWKSEDNFWELVLTFHLSGAGSLVSAAVLCRGVCSRLAGLWAFRQFVLPACSLSVGMLGLQVLITTSVSVGSLVGHAFTHWAISLVYEDYFCGKEPKGLGFPRQGHILL